MDYRFNAEQEMLRDSVRKFARSECGDDLFRRMDEEGYYPDHLYRQMGRLGFIGIPLPERYGGAGLGCVESALFQEELSKRLLPLQMTFQVSVLAAGIAILDLGSDEQKEEFLPPLARGEIKFSIAYTEPEAGSDAASIRTAAVRDGDGFRVSGQKIFITGADISDYMIVSTRSRRDVPSRDGITALIIDTKAEGVEIKPIPKLGVKASSYCAVYLDNVPVPLRRVIGAADKGWPVVGHSLELDRIGAAARWVGFGQEALDYGLDYARTRMQFGKPIGRFAEIREIFAQLQTELDAARLLTYRAASLFDAGETCRKEASIAKLNASELVVRLTRDMMQVLGGYSYAMEYHAQRFLRDCQFATIGAGTSQIQRQIIGKAMGL